MKKETSLKRFFKKLNVFGWYYRYYKNLDVTSESDGDFISLTILSLIFFVIVCGGAFMPRKPENKQAGCVEVKQAECESYRVHLTGEIKLEKPEEGGD